MKAYLITLVILLVSYFNAFAASTNTVTKTVQGPFIIVTVDIVADATDGSIDNTTISGICAPLIMAAVDPGTPAPTNLYDAYLFEGVVNGVRVMGSRMVDLSSVSATQLSPNVNNSSWFPRPVCDDLILRVFNNTELGAQTEFRFYFLRSPNIPYVEMTQ